MTQGMENNFNLTTFYTMDNATPNINSLSILLSKLPQEIQQEIWNYKTTSTIWNSKKEKENIINDCQTSKYCCDNCKQYFGLLYENPHKSRQAKLFKEDDYKTKNERSENSRHVEISTIQCHPRFDLLAVGAGSFDDLHIFNKENQHITVFPNENVALMDFNPYTKELIISNYKPYITLYNFTNTEPSKKFFKNPYYDKKSFFFYTKFISFDPTGKFINIISNKEDITTITPYEWIIYHALLKKTITMGLSVKKPSKKIDSVTKLLTYNAQLFNINEKILQSTWNTLPEEIQNNLWNYANYFIKTYGNPYAPKTSENEFSLITSECTTQ